MSTNYGRSLTNPPVPNDSPSIHDLVLTELPDLHASAIAEDFEARKYQGLEEYGVPLQIHNERDGLFEAYHEILDAIAYLRKDIEEGNLESKSFYKTAVYFACNLRGAIVAREAQLNG